MGADKYSVGKMIKRLRESEGLSQEDFAREMKLSRGDIEKLEAGGQNIAHIVKAALYFNISLDFLLTGNLSAVRDSGMAADITARLDDPDYLKELKSRDDYSSILPVLCGCVSKRGGITILKELMADGTGVAQNYFTDPSHASALVLRMLSGNSKNRISSLASSTKGWPWPNGIKSMLAAEDASLVESKSRSRCVLTDEVFDFIASDELSNEAFDYLLRPYDGKGTGIKDVCWVYGFPRIIDKCCGHKAGDRLNQILRTAGECNSKVCSALKASKDNGGKEPLKGFMALDINGVKFGYTAIMKRTFEEAERQNDFLLVRRFSDFNQALSDAGIKGVCTHLLDDIEELKAFIQAGKVSKDSRKELVRIVDELEAERFRDVALDLCILMENFFNAKYSCKSKLKDLLDMAREGNDISRDQYECLDRLRVYRNRLSHPKDPESSLYIDIMERLDRDSVYRRNFLMDCIKQVCLALKEPVTAGHYA